MSSPLDGNGVAAWPPRDWQCPKCSYRSYCTFDADKGGPGNDLRCLNCKAVFRAPPAPSQTAVEPVAELVTLLTERDGQEFDGEIHLSSEEGARFASTLTAQAAEVATLKARIAELDAGLAFYASKANYADVPLQQWFRENEGKDAPTGYRCGNIDISAKPGHAIAPIFADLGDLARRLTHQEKNNGR